MYQFSEAVISICPEVPDLKAAEEKYHRNIHITGNEFHLYDYPVLYAKSVDSLEFTRNLLTRSYRFQPFHPRHYTFSFLSCSNVEVTDNTISDEVLGRNILLEGMEAEEILVGRDQDLTIH